MARAHAVGTIIAHNYAAQARVLARSFVEHHPDGRFFTLIIDGSDEDRLADGLGTVVLPEDLSIDPLDLRSMLTMYDVMEFATALKPAFLLHLHHQNVRSATYLDPDIRVYAPLDDVFETAEASGIALTPHALQPVPRDGMSLAEADIAHAGIYNLGFISTGSSAVRFLAWWHERLKTDAVVDLGRALFTDQRWVDWAPAIEAVEILRDPGLNAAYWNIHERPVTRDTEGAWLVGGARLRFFHFSGYDPEAPHVFSKHLGDRPRTLLSEHPELAALCSAYGDELVAMGHPTLKREPYRHNVTSGGIRLLPAVRRLWRTARLAGELPPDPFDEHDAFENWVTGPGGDAGGCFSRFDMMIWASRPDVRAVFPDPAGASRAGFEAWLRSDPYPATIAEDLGLVRVEADEPEPERDGWGWSVAGYARAELGVGEAARRLSLAVAQVGVPWEMVGITDGPLSRQEHAYRGRLQTRPRYDNLILSVNADQTPAVLERWQHSAPGRRIGYWFWELAEFPAHYGRSFDLLDEVWVASEFNRRAVAARTDKPVRVVPLPIPAVGAPTRFTRSDLGMPEDEFVFVTSFDYLSVLNRKNPLAAIAAYKEAFAPGEGACLIVKSINGHLRPYERERVRAAAAGRPDIRLHEAYMTSTEVRAFIELADALVSLHRSEGYGLNLADAMQLGTPVVATAYSGNVDFMNEASAQLVGYDLVEVGPGSAPYSPDAVWAEPRHAEAVRAMRALFDDPALNKRIVDAARAHLAQFSAVNVARSLRPLLVPSEMSGNKEWKQ